jgi:phospholipase A1
MKKLLILLLLIPINTFALEKIQPHHPTYIIAGDKDNQVKYQISIKYPLWYPYESGIAVAYTQTAHWNLYDKSSPFKELNHNPEIFIERTNDIKFIDFYRVIPYTHVSNGLDGDNSRSVDAGAVEMQLSYGEFINFGIREKITCFYNLACQNKDYKRYRGNFETELFAQIKSRKGYFSHEKIYIKGEWTKHFGWLECGLSTRIITTKFRPHIYIQYFYGYSEFLIDYNQKTNALRGGFIFNE